MKEKKDSFIMRGKWVRALANVTPKERLRVYDDIFRYAFIGELPKKTYPIFELIKEDIDIDNDSYDKKCERNKANGFKGGRPKKTENKEPQNNPTVIEKPNGYSENPKKPINNNININKNNNKNNNNKKDTNSNELVKKKNNEPHGSTPEGQENLVSVKLTEGEKEKICAKKEKEFYDMITPFVGKYEKEMLREFYDYWREWNKSKSKMRWEINKTWDINLRLATWAKNEKKGYGRKTNQNGSSYNATELGSIVAAGIALAKGNN